MASMCENKCYVRSEDRLSEEEIESLQPIEEIVDVKQFSTATEEAWEIVKVINKEKLVVWK